MIVVFILFGYLFTLSPNQTPKILSGKTQAQTITVYQTIQELTKKHNIKSSSTALDLLRNTTQATIQGEGVNAFITEINGLKADPNKKEFWSFYINNQASQVGAGSYYLKPGDKIQWKIETY